ncbi:MAG: zinc-binding dehydrogenase, partial [Rhodobacteraceae bacterium]|nr:zinc-binding dehydrogenase [Paracoccaceae bacterium]
IGIMVALAALAGGCARVIVSDISAAKLALAAGYDGITTVDVSHESLSAAVMRETGGWGGDVVFEASGSPHVYGDLLRAARPGGCVVLVGLPPSSVSFDVNAAIARELRIETVFRYANVFDRALELIASGRIDLRPLITETFAFEDSVTAFKRAAEGRATDVKLQIRVAREGDV